MLVLQRSDVLQRGVVVDDGLGRRVEPSLVMAASRLRTKIHAGLARAIASTEMSSMWCVSRSNPRFERRFAAEQVEDRALRATPLPGAVADAAAGDANRHDGRGAIGAFFARLIDALKSSTSFFASSRFLPKIHPGP